MRKIVILLAFVLTVACGGSANPSSSAVDEPDTVEVAYKVFGEGTSTASLTIENETGNTEQMDVDLPWERRFTAEPGQIVYLSAQNNEDAGTIKCQILVDGGLKETAESSGAFAIASCSGTAD